jgi:hypothetical protein
VAPGQSQVISLAPEFISPQDGSEKQDSEVAAAKRWIAIHQADSNSKFKKAKKSLRSEGEGSHRA